MAVMKEAAANLPMPFRGRGLRRRWQAMELRARWRHRRRPLLSSHGQHQGQGDPSRSPALRRVPMCPPAGVVPPPPPVKKAQIANPASSTVGIDLAQPVGAATAARHGRGNQGKGKGQKGKKGDQKGSKSWWQHGKSATVLGPFRHTTHSSSEEECGRSARAADEGSPARPAPVVSAIERFSSASRRACVRHPSHGSGRRQSRTAGATSEQRSAGTGCGRSGRWRVCG